MPISASGRRSRSMSSPTARRSPAMPRIRSVRTWSSCCAGPPRRRVGNGIAVAHLTNTARAWARRGPRAFTHPTARNLHRPSEPDGVEHRGGRKVSVRQLPDQAGLHHVDKRRVHAPVGGVGVGEIALLQRQAPEVVPRHGTGLVQPADEEVGEWLLRLGLMLGLWLMLTLGLMLRLSLMRRMRLRLMNGLGRRFTALCPRRGGYCFEPTKLDLHHPVHRLKLGLEILNSGVLLSLELLDQFLELSLVGVDLLFKQSGPVLQVPANITHCLPLVHDVAPTTERAGRFTQDQTNPAGRRSASDLRGPAKEIGRAHV